MGWMFCIVVDCLGGLDCFIVHAELVSCVWVPVISVEVTAGDLHSYLMTLLNHKTGRPQINGVFVDFTRLD